MKEVEIRKGLLVREDGMIKNITGHPLATKGWNTGNPSCTGYRIVKVPNVGTKKIHKLVAEAFLPKIENMTEINHINCDKSDNRVENLEYVTHRTNMMKQTKHIKNEKLVGCTFHKASGKWHAKIKVGEKMVSLKYHNTELDAHNAYMTYINDNLIT